MAGTMRFSGGVLALALALGPAAACDRQDEAPPATVQTATPPQAANEPVTVNGCLKAGEAADTFVLTTARTAEGQQTATYHLVAGAGIDLASHVGRQVEITGTVDARQKVQTRSSTDPAPNATATSGAAPTVSTSTELQVRNLEVSQVRPVGGECAM